MKALSRKENNVAGELDSLKMTRNSLLQCPITIINIIISKKEGYRRPNSLKTTRNTIVNQ